MREEGRGKKEYGTKEGRGKKGKRGREEGERGRESGREGG